MTALAVIAKAPVAGRVKTRLCPPCTPVEAAALAEAAIADTLTAVRATDAERRVLILDGEPGAWVGDGIEVIAQRGAGLDERLAGAFEDIGEPTFLIGMDTPQVTPALLADGLRSLDHHPAAIGRAHDGGYWAIGLRAPDRRALEGVPMSRADPGEAQVARLTELGLTPLELPALQDVDDIDSARSVAVAAPGTAFGRAFAAWEQHGVRGMNAPPSRVYAHGLERPHLAYRLRLDSGATRPVPFERWLGPVSAADLQVLDRAAGPVLDVGCGPGRHVRALAERGVLALGVDASSAAIRLARSRGTSVFEGSVFDEIPGAGEWRSALLLDGNLGIGGRPEPLLRRVGALLRRGGTILAEVEPPGGFTGRQRARLEGPNLVSRWFAWATVCADGVEPIVAAAGMGLRERFTHGGRWFVEVQA
jgi:glycosyltransferase A (GT-A) superfamily protein (DUF2064 family)/SAM-dependent methyltransferase